MPAATPHGPSRLRISLPVENVMNNVYVVNLNSSPQHERTPSTRSSPHSSCMCRSALLGVYGANSDEPPRVLSKNALTYNNINYTYL